MEPGKQRRVATGLAEPPGAVDGTEVPAVVGEGWVLGVEDAGRWLGSPEAIVAPGEDGGGATIGEDVSTAEPQPVTISAPTEKAISIIRRPRPAPRRRDVPWRAFISGVSGKVTVG